MASERQKPRQGNVGKINVSPKSNSICIPIENVLNDPGFCDLKFRANLTWPKITSQDHRNEQWTQQNEPRILYLLQRMFLTLSNRFLVSHLRRTEVV